jgi:hypothetical protein
MVDDFQTRKKILESHETLQQHTEALKTESKAIQLRLAALQNPDLLTLDDQTSLSGLDLLTLIDEMHRETNRSVSKHLKRIGMATFTVLLAITGYAYASKGTYRRIFCGEPDQRDLEKLFRLSSKDVHLSQALTHLANLRLLEKKEALLVGSHGEFTTSWKLTRLGRQVLRQWKVHRALTPEVLTLSPQVLASQENILKILENQTQARLSKGVSQ